MGSLAKTWSGCLQQIHVRKGAFHDISSATHDRRHASAQSRGRHPGHLPTPCLSVRTSLRQVPGSFGREQIRSFQVYLIQEKKLDPSTITVAVSAIRFLYKVTLRRQWNFDEIIPAPKRPRRLPVILSPEEILQFLDRVPAVKHRTILTTCYAAGLRVSEVVRLLISDIDSQQMVIRIEQSKGQKDRYVML